MVVEGKFISFRKATGEEVISMAITEFLAEGAGEWCWGVE
jgi:hypothetical protein